MPAPVAVSAEVSLDSIPPVPTSLPAAADPDPGQGAGVGHLADRRRGRQPRVAGVQRIDVGQQDQRAGADQMRHQCGEPIVVAEPDLGGRDGVVLVHHRHHAEGQQLAERPLGVAVVRAPHDIVAGQQDLPDGQLVPGERAGVALGQQLLPDGGGGLLGRQITGPALQAERRQPGGDRTGGHQHHLRSGGHPAGDGVHQRVEPGRIQSAGRGRQRRRPDLDHDDLGRGRRRAGTSDRRSAAHQGAPPPVTADRHPCRAVHPVVRRGCGPRRPARGAAGACALRSAAPTRSIWSSRRSVPRPVGTMSTPAKRGRLPVEGDVADGHRRTGLGAVRGQLRLDAEPGQPVGEVADGLVVVEVGLQDPAFRAGAADDEAAVDLGIGLDLELLGIDRLRAHHDPRRGRGRLVGPVGGHHLGEGEPQFGQPLVGDGGDREDPVPGRLEIGP